MIRSTDAKQAGTTLNSIYSPRTPRGGGQRTPRKTSRENLLNTKRAKTPELLFDKADIFACDISDDVVVFGNEMGMIEVFQKDTLERTKTLNYAPSRGENVMTVKFINGNRLISGDTLGNVVMYNTEYENLIKSTDARDNNTVSPICVLDKDDSVSINSKSQVSVNCLDFNRTNTICGVFSDKSIRLYDSNTSVLMNTVKQSVDIGDGTISHLSGHTRQPHCCKFLDEEMFVTAGWDDCLKIWDRRAPQSAVLSINGVHVCGPSIDVRPGSDNKVLAVGSWRAENGLQLWDLRKAGDNSEINDTNGASKSFKLTKRKELDHNGDYIYATKFLDKNTLLAGGSGSAKVLAVDVDSGEIVDKIGFGGKTIQSIAVGRDDIVIGGVKGAVKVIPR